MLRHFMAALLLVAIALPVSANVPREISWDTLVPETEPLEDPFSHLTLDQRYDLEAIAYLRQFQVRGLVSDVSPEVTEVVEITYQLEQQGLDVDALLAEYDRLSAEVDRRNQLVVGDLDGQLVRLPGYVLPLEFTEGGVTEFLLVPYVGACIHVPPPPPNQMVFVRLTDAYEAEYLYEPVWIVGRMTVERTDTLLSFVDGENRVAAGYALDGLKIEPYEEW